MKRRPENVLSSLELSIDLFKNVIHCQDVMFAEYFGKKEAKYVIGDKISRIINILLNIAIFRLMKAEIY